MKPIITRFNKNNGDIELTISMFDKDIFRRIEQIELCNPSWFDTEHYNIFDLIKENQKYKEVINKVNKKLNNFIECCKAEKLESGSDYLHHQYWDMFERFNKQIKDILKEVE